VTDIHDVVVVGAGVAGLRAAHRLCDFDVVVLESESDVGGRTLSRQLGDYVYNVGAQVILGDTGPAASLADELGVSRTLIRKSRVPLFFNNRLYHSATQPGLLMSLPIGLRDKIEFARQALSIRYRFGSLASSEFDARDPRLTELTRESLSDFLGGLSPGLYALWQAISTIADGEPPELATPFHPIMVMLHFLAAEYAVTDGSHALTKALAREVGSRLRANAKVKAIRPGAHGVVVEATEQGVERSYNARKCVIAVPAPVACNLLVDAPWWKMNALEQVGYTAQTSAAFLLDIPSERLLAPGVWRVPVSGRRICAVTDPSFFYAESYRAQAGTGMLRVYTGDVVSRQLADVDNQQALRELTHELNILFPGIDAHVLDADVHHWRNANPRWDAGYPERYEILGKPCGDLHFCGDYTSPGYMNGSISSGERVAVEVAGALEIGPGRVRS